MLLSAQQQAFFWRLWAEACRQQGWDALPAAERDAQRKAVLAGVGFASLKLVDRTRGFTRVMERLKELSGSVSVVGDRDAENEARNLRWIVRERLLPCLGVYIADAEAYVREVCRGKFGRADWESLGNASGDDVQDGDMRQLVVTLNARLDAMRNRAGDSRCDMSRIAGVTCTCKRCK